MKSLKFDSVLRKKVEQYFILRFILIFKSIFKGYLGHQKNSLQLKQLLGKPINHRIGKYFCVSTQEYMKLRSIFKYFINHSFRFRKISNLLLHEI